VTINKALAVRVLSSVEQVLGRKTSSFAVIPPRTTFLNLMLFYLIGHFDSLFELNPI
jgi:hypothetical protein